MTKPITIFYTDDDLEDLESFTEAASDLDHVNVHTMTDAESLIAALHNPPPSPHIIFLDLNMPGLNGLDALKRIKASEKMAGYPVVIFTTSDDPETISKTKELGANLFITKPSTYPELKDAIKYSVQLDWNSFSPDSKQFIYRGN